jgi:hypothetical protein
MDVKLRLFSLVVVTGKKKKKTEVIEISDIENDLIRRSRGADKSGSTVMREQRQMDVTNILFFTFM